MLSLRPRKVVNYVALNEGVSVSEKNTCRLDILPDLYNIERIIWRKETSDGTMYLVKWQGYHITDSTWEPKGHIPESILNNYFNPDINESRTTYFASSFERAFQLRLNSNNPKSTMSIDLDIYRKFFGEKSSLLELNDFDCLNMHDHWFYRLSKDGSGRKIKFPVRLTPKVHQRKIYSKNGSDVMLKLYPEERCVMYSATEACVLDDL